MKSALKLILASASPRRHALLRALNVEFEVAVADIDESGLPGEEALDYVPRVALAKAHAIQSMHPSNAVLAADTIVAVDGEILGKPQDQEHAHEMWHKLSARKHDVISSVCLMFEGGENPVIELKTVSTQVQMCAIDSAMMAAYWASGEPADKAGAYAIQGFASAWVQEVHGSYSNVVGLPLFETNQLLRLVGHNWL